MPSEETPNVLENAKIKYIRPWVYEKQYNALFNPKRYAIVEASTKTGKTVGCIIWILEQALKGKDGQQFWWVAPVFGQAEIAFRRLKKFLPREMYVAHESHLKISLPNGTQIWFKSADKPDSLYGEDVWAAVIDEASRVKEEAWHAVRSTLTRTQGPLRVIGNVKGRKNWFYALARKAEAGDPAMHYTKLLAYDAVEAEVLSLEEVEDAKRQLPEQVFRELYLAEPSDDGGNPFGLKAIRSRVTALSDKDPVAWGIDLAKSVDWTVAIGLDDYGHTCRFERWQSPWQETIKRIRRLVGSVPALVDSTGVGDPILEALQEDGNNFEGFKFSSSSKQQLMEGLAIAIQQEKIAYPDGIIPMELECFEYEYTRTGVTYSAPAGMHDDCVCALALANRRRTTQLPGMGLMAVYEEEFNAIQARHKREETN